MSGRFLDGLEFLPQLNPTSFFTAGTFALVLVALIKVWPILALQVQRAREKLREEGRSDLEDCKERLDRMSVRIDTMHDALNNLKIEMAGVLSAYRILEVAEERREPSSVHLAQARAVLSAAYSVGPSTNGPSKKTETKQ